MLFSHVLTAEYIGCFQVRGFFHDPSSYYYDPNHNLLSHDMHIDPALYAVGTMYAVSGKVAEGLAALPLALRDFGPNEGEFPMHSMKEMLLCC